ncbi:hypothetical protein X943_001036 [Babesia divergens]|uniref:Uncharacterized protein n=1 Tax=Babesia divergens TaxID=32595 RepID=A0AAD9LIY3_BABDI|nr:hypothetical protein X943_001036 [Babesia divergens]
MALLSTDSARCSELSWNDVDSSGSQVLSLCDVDLLGLMNDEESTCSPFSDNFDLKAGGSILSDDPNYLWYVKQQAEMLRGPSVAARGNRRHDGSDVDSDVSSTCVMVNIKHDTCVNLCDNPSDMWHGLKMSDGMPVVIRSNRNRPKPFNVKKGRRSIAKYTGSEGTSGTTSAPISCQKTVSRESGHPASTGPINYCGGFLSLHNYVGRGNGAGLIYRLHRVDPKSAHRSHRKEIKGRQRLQQVQRHLARARGIVF